MCFQNGEYAKLRYVAYGDFNVEGVFEVGETVQLWDVDWWNHMAMLMKDGERYFIDLLQVEKIK